MNNLSLMLYIAGIGEKLEVLIGQSHIKSE